MTDRLIASLMASIACLLGGCTPLLPYRTEPPPATSGGPFADRNLEVCSLSDKAGEQTVSGRVDAACARRIREDSDKYRLYFSEYDDQGWAFPAGEKYGSAAKQATIFSKDLQSLLKNPAERVSVVVFVHGWKHGASTDDGNVRSFRRLLSDLAEVEELSETKCRRRVVGVYVGWRGAASTLGFLENLSFWNRKEAAQRVALGDVRMLFSELREIQDAANVKWNASLEASLKVSSPSGEQSQLNPCDKRMKLSIAGHSFGGLIVYTSIAQSLIRDIVALRFDETLQSSVPATDRVRPILQREGDLVVVINPAIEATRFHPLFRAVSEAQLPHYHTPIFVSITSDGDQATKRAFPIGRWFSTRFDKYPEDRWESEEAANLYTVGHADEFITHDLSVLNSASVPQNSPCRDWIADQPFSIRLAVEQRNLDSFRRRLADQGYDATNVLSRQFCGLETMSLTARPSMKTWAGNSPVWNVATSPPIVKDHNDFENPLLLEVLRQLYMEAEDRSLVRLRTSK
ncbi:MAG: hypothetical protein ABI645_05345 [Pseudomonadota bacterium]